MFIKEEMAEDGVVSESENATRSVICQGFFEQERISRVDITIMRPFEEDWVRSTCEVNLFCFAIVVRIEKDWHSNFDIYVTTAL